jgi:hypothetical protein
MAWQSDHGACVLPAMKPPTIPFLVERKTPLALSIPLSTASTASPACRSALVGRGCALHLANPQSRITTKVDIASEKLAMVVGMISLWPKSRLGGSAGGKAHEGAWRRREAPRGVAHCGISDLERKVYSGASSRPALSLIAPHFAVPPSPRPPRSSTLSPPPAGPWTGQRREGASQTTRSSRL